MYRTKTETKLVWWPTPQDYNEAVQTPQACLQDPELKNGLPYTNALDLPRSITGSFASVYRMHCKKNDFALRLFLSNIHDQHQRYGLISDFVQHDDLPYTVTFDFLKKGIKLHGEWFPALKMEWLEGDQLDDYIVENLSNPEKLGELLEKFLVMMKDLRRAGIAHGDLQHGNILVCQNELRLVDYDGMFVPAMKGFQAGELGHRNYQHPERAAKHFGAYLDNFSAWIIYASIRALQIDSRLMHQLGGGDDCLLFRQSDFMDPLHSPAFAALERHSDVRLNELGRFIRAILKMDLENIPFLVGPLPQLNDVPLHPVSENAPVVKNGARIVRGNLPDWLQDHNVAILSKGGDATPLHASPPQSWTIPSQPKQQSVWLKPGSAAAITAASTGQNPGQTSPQNSAQNSNSLNIQPPPLSRATNKLNQLTNSINTASQKKQRQIRASQQNRFTQALAAKATTSQTQLSPLIPIELNAQTIPRKVHWNTNCGRISPRDACCIMLLNPIVWFMMNFGASALGIDGQLATQGVLTPAVVTDVMRYPGRNGHTDVSYYYKFDGHIYSKQEQRSNGPTFETGNKHAVVVLPSNPTITESLDSPAGKKRDTDVLFFALAALANLGILTAFLYPSIIHKNLAMRGKAYVAKIDSLKLIDQTTCKVDVVFHVDGHPTFKSTSVSVDEFHTLRTGKWEIILFDEKTQDLVFYRFCRYVPTSTNSKITTVP